jgi:ribosomal protein S18 acetylase RimI-like enzyme
MEAAIFPEGDIFQEEDYLYFHSFWIMRGLIRIGSLGFCPDAGLWTYAQKQPPVEPGTMFLVSVGVLPMYRRSGAARAALDFCCEMADQFGQQRLLSCCRSQNVASCALHEATGFLLTRLQENFYTAPVDAACIYEKILC